MVVRIFKIAASGYPKIDEQFVRHLPGDALDQAAVRCFVEVARVVGLTTVAELVAQPRLLAKVREMGDPEFADLRSLTRTITPLWIQASPQDRLVIEILANWSCAFPN